MCLSLVLLIVACMNDNDGCPCASSSATLPTSATTTTSNKNNSSKNASNYSSMSVSSGSSGNSPLPASMMWSGRRGYQAIQ